MKRIVRKTRETSIEIGIAERGAEDNALPATGNAFLDHMLLTLGRYAGLNLAIAANGDLTHHLIEDVAITLGLALKDQVPPECQRYGSALVPMDDALVQAAIDVGGRPYYEGRLPSALYEHFFRSLAGSADWTVHIRVLRGRDKHHIVEAAFKAVGLALRQARANGDAVFSTKGAVLVEREDG